MRTEQDKINRKEANQRYYKLEENKEQKRNYMKAYRVNKMRWGEIKKPKEQDNDLLNAENTERFTNDT